MKQLKLTFLLTVLMSMVGAKVFAYDACIDGIYYNFSGTNAIVTYLTNIGDPNREAYSGSVVIPETVTYDGTTYFVTSIGNSAFEYCKDLTSVTIPSSVNTIGNFAFSGCTGLTKAEFSSVDHLFSIEFGNKLSNPLYNAHHLYINGKEITEVVIPNFVTNVSSYIFQNCSGLTSVTIPNTVTSIGDNAFHGCI